MMTECKRCILHDGIPGVRLEPDGTCNYCSLHDEWELNNDPLHGEAWLRSVYQEMRMERTGEYDCIIGVSGGADSSWVLKEIVDYGLNPLAVHWNNNWNTKIATDNIRKLVEGLGVDLYQVGINAEEYNDLCRSFLLASVPDADVPNDIALATVLYQACERFDCKYLINAHSFRTEGTTPLGWSYMDGGYIEDVHARFGRWPLKKFPNLTYDLFKHYIELGIQRIRPLWSLNYDKQKAIKELEDRFGWKWYNFHHGENEYTIFVGNYLWPKKFNMDLRFVEYSALIRSGFMDRRDALDTMFDPPTYPSRLPGKIRRTLHMTKTEWDLMIEAPVKTFRDYGSYRERFKEDQEYFEAAVAKDLVPATFYRKYVLGVQ